MHDGANGIPGNTPQSSPSVANQRIIMMTGMSLAIAFLFASLYPKPVVLAVFSSLLLLAAIASALTAVLLVQRPFVEHLNLWDKALLLTFFGMAAGLFVDIEAVKAFIEAQSAAPAGAEATAPSSGGAAPMNHR